MAEAPTKQDQFLHSMMSHQSSIDSKIVLDLREEVMRLMDKQPYVRTDSKFSKNTWDALNRHHSDTSDSKPSAEQEQTFTSTAPAGEEPISLERMNVIICDGTINSLIRLLII